MIIECWILNIIWNQDGATVQWFFLVFHQILLRKTYYVTSCSLITSRILIQFVVKVDISCYMITGVRARDSTAADREKTDSHGWAWAWGFPLYHSPPIIKSRHVEIFTFLLIVPSGLVWSSLFWLFPRKLKTLTDVWAWLGLFIPTWSLGRYVGLVVKQNIEPSTEYLEHFLTSQMFCRSSGTAPVWTITGKASRHFPKHKAKANMRSLINYVTSAVQWSWELGAGSYTQLCLLIRRLLRKILSGNECSWQQNKATINPPGLSLPIMLLSSSNREIITEYRLPYFHIILHPLPWCI